MSESRTESTKIRSANILLAAVGLVGIGVMIGGWTNAQPASTPQRTVTGIAVDPTNNYLYRTYSTGRVERLVLGQGVTQRGTTANWEVFKP